MKLPLSAYSTATNVAMSTWVSLELNDKEKTGASVEGSGQNKQLGDLN